MPSKPIALFDIDNTMYDGFSYFELLEKQVAEGLLAPQVSAAAKSSLHKYQSKLQDYETTIVELLEIYAAGLKGARYAKVLSSTRNFYQSSKKFFSYVEPTIRQLSATHDIALVTGEPQFVAQAVGERFGIQSYYSSVYKVYKGKFTGEVSGYLASRHEKLAAIHSLMHSHGARQSFAFGDSEGDIEMLRSVAFPICLNPTSGLRAIADQEGWPIPKMQEVTALVTKLVQNQQDQAD